jgi:putative acetyltransferase
MRIVLDDLAGPEIAALLAAHLDGMHRHSPPERVHALHLDALRSPDITFWTAWDDTGLLGCAALRELDDRHGEIKSMRTADVHLRKGVAARLLEHLIAEAGRRRYTRLSLETGSGAAFEPAHALYRKYGFEYCGPFDGYTDDPFSRFMTLALPA